ALVAIALTDHDTVAGLAEARAIGEELGVRIVNGVELSAVEGDSETHLLGLREMRGRRAARIVGLLQSQGVQVTLDDVLMQAGTGAIGRPHVARALVADGWAVDVRDAFDRYLAAGRPAYV